MDRVRMRLVGEDGNAFAILGRFQRAARAVGWTREQIQAVLDEATRGDYDHLLATMIQHVEEPAEDDGGADGDRANDQDARER